MKKEELLSILLSNIDCFKGVSENDFYNLAILDTYELSFMDDKVAKVTPLLKQIVEYALINAVLTDEQINSIGCCFDEDDNLFNDSIDLIDICHKYVIALIDEDCHHPSILTSDSLTKGLTLYNEFNEILGTIIEMTDGEFQDNLIDLGGVIDEKVADVIDGEFDKLIDKLRSSYVDDKRKLISILSCFSKSILNMVMAISEMKSDNLVEGYCNTLYIDDNYIHILSNDKNSFDSDSTMLNFLNSFISIIKIVDGYKNDSFDEDINCLIENLEDVYFLYKAYKYKYLKDDYREKRLLSKCKKL